MSLATAYAKKELGLKQIFLLGSRAAGLFRQIALPELRERRNLLVYSVRHPSFSWAVQNLDEQLRQDLREPWAWPEGAEGSGRK
jgi:hypothetical protein